MSGSWLWLMSGRWRGCRRHEEEEEEEVEEKDENLTSTRGSLSSVLERGEGG